MKDKEFFARFLNTVCAECFQSIICDDIYSLRDILQVEDGIFVDTVDTKDPVDPYKILEHKDMLEERCRTRYKHINEIYKALDSVTKKKKVPSIDVKNSKYISNETILDDLIIKYKDQLLNTMMIKTGFYAKELIRTNMTIPEELSDQRVVDFINKLDSYQLHTLTSDVHNYVPKRGEISLLEAYTIAILSSNVWNRTIGLLSKMVNKKKANQLYEQIERYVMEDKKDEMLDFLIISEIWKRCRHDEDNVEERPNLFNYFLDTLWIRVFPMIEMLLCNDIKLEELRQDAKEVWKDKKNHYFYWVEDYFEVEVKYALCYEDIFISEENFAMIEQMYGIIQTFKSELKKTALYIIKELPLFQILK